ncbi:HepT-like ribonuclease domain-containing protein [Deinococcus wulumuqiensis]|uniref:DUF86 domain-containing protein n=1 Tax=Deinococcus wulumuqiensis TaxID=980427 RepID=A0A345IJF0_9DEIO|nr:HepT-like ribonuclease domain-containing protein [Deinococcus wulumuqiensis]AXG99822.1 DUF86 domain-containing protein [Deinococcus wulumuqiensis]QII21078.1 DUF86 domain-containing protein [Deinococcus wulumuqiensis R12]GGI89002.1 hypothetical protein GCM10010914_24230 [Deinococcus wulumuqiensis]GGP30468.1 hypothetical protein GCM10008021_21190 [Deinococcus wulumuqiensis]
MRDYNDVLTKSLELAALMRTRGIDAIALGLTEPTSDHTERRLLLSLSYSSGKDLLEEAVDEADVAALFAVEQEDVFNDLPRLVGGVLRLDLEGNLIIYGIGGGTGAPELSDRLRHMLDCIHALKRHLSLIEEARFVSARPTHSEKAVIDAVIWQLTRFGEACAAIPREEWEQHRSIDFRAYKALRNKLVHQYFHISTKKVWKEAVRCIALEGTLASALTAQQGRENSGELD